MALHRPLRNPYLVVLAALSVVSIVAAVILHLWARSLVHGGGEVRYSTAPLARVDPFAILNWAGEAELAAVVLVAATLVTGAVFWRRDRSSA